MHTRHVRVLTGVRVGRRWMADWLPLHLAISARANCITSLIASPFYIWAAHQPLMTLLSNREDRKIKWMGIVNFTVASTFCKLFPKIFPCYKVILIVIQPCVHFICEWEKQQQGELTHLHLKSTNREYKQTENTFIMRQRYHGFKNQLVTFRVKVYSVSQSRKFW